MYESFFGLSTNPFSLTPNPEFLYLTREHREAITGILYGVLSRKGIIVLTGDAGTGKTTLLRAVMRSVPSTRAEFRYVLNPVLSPDEFFRMALVQFGVTAMCTRRGEMFSSLYDYLLRANEKNRSVVLVVDEAQRLTPELLEEIRLLANFETEENKLIQIVLAGQDELDTILDRHDLRQLKQRVALRLRIPHLNTEQVEEYVRHRWDKITTTPLPFTPDALRAIAAFSNGVPRVVNALCDNALLQAFGGGLATVSHEAIYEVARALHLNVSAPAAELIAPVPVTDVESLRSTKNNNHCATSLPSLEAYAQARRWPFRWTRSRPVSVENVR